MTEKRKQRHRPHAGDDRPGKHSRIAFWDNIFYWLWHYVARSGGYAFRAGGIIALHQLPGRGGGVDALPARKGQRHSGRPCHPAPSRPDDNPFIHLQGKPVREAEIPLRADGRQRKGKAQNGLPGVPRRDSRGRVCRVPAVLPLRRAIPDAGIGRRKGNRTAKEKTQFPDIGGVFFQK